MNKLKNKKHDFHLVLKAELKNKIISLGLELNLGISEASLHILDKTICILNKYHYDIEEVDEISEYQHIDWDEDMHVFMDERLYRRIKHLADTMFAFSIAIVIRKLFNLYFEMLELSKGKLERVESIFKRFYLLYVKKYGENLIYWKKCLLKKQLLGKFQYYLEFNDKFSITGFNFIKSD